MIWGIYSSKRTLNEDFIRKNKDNVDWLYISSCLKLSCKFIKEF